MMHEISIKLILLFMAVLFSNSTFGQVQSKDDSLSKKVTLRILSDRTQSHLTPIFESFRKETGIEIQSLFVDQGLIARLETNPNEADIVITKDADIMEIAKKRGLLSPFESEKLISRVPSDFRDSENYYFSDSFRGRVIFYSKDRVKVSDLDSYQDLALPKWKKRICIRSGYDDYNVNLFAQWLLVYGEEQGKKVILGLHNNLAKSPAGNDRDQVRNILEKKCDIAIVNSYYMGIMMHNRDQQEWGLSSRVFFPDQKQKGSLILRSGLALTKNPKQRTQATQFLEYMMEPKNQEYTAKATFAYPVTNPEALAEENQKLGEGQSEVKNGKFKFNAISPKAIADLRGKIIQYLDQIHFDKVD